MSMLLVFALLASPPALADRGKTEFERCMAGATIDTFLEFSSKCLKAEKALPPETPNDPIAKAVADREASKYTDVYASDYGTDLDRCVQAGLTAQAYLDAGMPRAYDSWKRTEQIDCRRYYRSATGRR